MDREKAWEIRGKILSILPLDKSFVFIISSSLNSPRVFYKQRVLGVDVVGEGGSYSLSVCTSQGVFPNIEEWGFSPRESCIFGRLVRECGDMKEIVNVIFLYFEDLGKDVL